MLKLESRAIAARVPCHHVILVASIAVTATPSRKRACHFLRGTDNLSHAVLSDESGKFYTTIIYSRFNRSGCVSMWLPFWWRFGLYVSGSSLEFWWCDAPLEFQMLSRHCEQCDCHCVFRISAWHVWYGPKISNVLSGMIDSGPLYPEDWCSLMDYSRFLIATSPHFSQQKA